MIPIAKNIKVVDEHGKEYEATYPKRAQGLVKNGRARFIDENTICLACPPSDDYTEDRIMSEKITGTDKYTVDYILEQIEKISKGEYLKELVSSALKNDPDDLTNTIVAREETNVKLIEFYSKVYDDIKPKREAIASFDELLNEMIGIMTDPNASVIDKQNVPVVIEYYKNAKELK